MKTSHAASVWRTSSHIRGMNYILQQVWKSYSLNSYRRYETRWDEYHTQLVWISYRRFCCAAKEQENHISYITRLAGAPRTPSDHFSTPLLLNIFLRHCLIQRHCSIVPRLLPRAERGNEPGDEARGIVSSCSCPSIEDRSNRNCPHTCSWVWHVRFVAISNSRVRV